MCSFKLESSCGFQLLGWDATTSVLSGSCQYYYRFGVLASKLTVHTDPFRCYDFLRQTGVLLKNLVPARLGDEKTCFLASVERFARLCILTRRTGGARPCGYSGIVP